MADGAEGGWGDGVRDAEGGTGGVQVDGGMSVI